MIFFPSFWILLFAFAKHFFFAFCIRIHIIEFDEHSKFQYNLRTQLAPSRKILVLFSILLLTLFFFLSVFALSFTLPTISFFLLLFFCWWCCCCHVFMVRPLPFMFDHKCKLKQNSNIRPCMKYTLRVNLY